MSTQDELPRYNELMLPVLRAVAALGGSATGREIAEFVLQAGGFTDAQMTLSYPTREKSVLEDRLEWARSYCKLTGALESPKRGLFLLSQLGRDIVNLDDAAATARLTALDREVRAARPRKKQSPIAGEQPQIEDDAPPVDPGEEGGAWTELLLGRLHRLTPKGFEEFCMYLLRRFGLELTRVGGSGDEGIDGIGTAPLSEVLSATVAVQAKRFDPSAAIGRDTVALFQRDAAAAGAERAVFVTLARFTAPARKAATTVTPHVDLIDGKRLCELVLAQEIGISLQPVVDEDWFDHFDSM